MTIYEALSAKLCREPTSAELRAEVERIKTEALVALAEQGKLKHQRYGHPAGHGATEQEAIADLQEQLDEAMDDAAYAQWCEDESRRDDAREGFDD